jgi:hypothetical protein
VDLRGLSGLTWAEVWLRKCPDLGCGIAVPAPLAWGFPYRVPAPRRVALCSQLLLLGPLEGVQEAGVPMGQPGGVGETKDSPPLGT